MNIVFFAHSPLLGSQSMPRFLNMLVEGMRKRGYSVKIFMPPLYLSRIAASAVIKKWLGYFDQYVIFPHKVKSMLKHCAPDTLFVFVDHALGPWLPLVADRPHVLHCHDFMAQKSALGLVEENRTRFFGRIYQSYIHRGYRQGKHFISVSRKTRDDLHSFLQGQPVHSLVVYNGLNGSFTPQTPSYAREMVSKHTGLPLHEGYLLHVGGNQWYKNRGGVIKIYNAWRSNSKNQLPLLMVGKSPDSDLLQAYERCPHKTDVHFCVNLPDDLLTMAYAGANAFLFPSLAEGFGWPIAEAMACGCPVVTTNAAPMTEVAGGAAFLIPGRPYGVASQGRWAAEAASVLQHVLELGASERAAVIEAGLLNARRFNPEAALDRIESIYRGVMNSYRKREKKFVLEKEVW